MTDASPTIAMGSDHRGYEAVDSISEHLRAAGWSIEILGRSLTGCVRVTAKWDSSYAQQNFPKYVPVARRA